jgi:hypothetical protein
MPVINREETEKITGDLELKRGDESIMIKLMPEEGDVFVVYLSAALTLEHKSGLVRLGGTRVAIEGVEGKGYMFNSGKLQAVMAFLYLEVLQVNQVFKKPASPAASTSQGSDSESESDGEGFQGGTWKVDKGTISLNKRGQKFVIVSNPSTMFLRDERSRTFFKDKMDGKWNKDKKEWEFPLKQEAKMIKFIEEKLDGEKE